MNKLLLTIAFTFISISILAQPPVISPMPGNSTICPGEEVFYTIQPGNFTNCGSYSWTVSNGSFSSTTSVTTKTTTSTTISVFWNDVASTGTLSVTSSCAEGTMTKSSIYAIKSLAGRVPLNIRSDFLNQYCGVSTMRVYVNQMLLENTGGATGITQQFADGYEWSLPAGWLHNGSSTSPVRTVEEFIDITPSDGCKGGNISVKAYVSCTSGRKYSNSSTSLSLNRPISTALIVPSGYTGPTCGNIAPVTFTATYLPCATNYRWTATNTQWKDSNGTLGAWNTATNTIALTPTGSPSDGGQIAAEITLSCGTIITQTYTAIYQDPALTNPSFTSNSVQLLCSYGSGTVAITPVTDAANYTWYTSGGTAYINGVVASQSNPVTTTSTSITLSAPLVKSIGYEVLLYVRANRANPLCNGSSIMVRHIWFGKPVEVQTIALGLDSPPPYYVCPSTTYQFNAFDFTNLTSLTTYSWTTSSNHTIQGYSGAGNITANIRTGTTVNNTWVRVIPQNACGTARFSTEAILYQSASCPGGGSFSVTPNPTSDYVDLIYTGEETPEFEFGLYDTYGTLYYKKQTKEKVNRIDARNLKDGLYILKIKVAKESLEYRVLVEK